MSLAQKGYKLGFKSRSLNFFPGIKSFVSRRLIHVSEMNRMRSGVKIWFWS